MRTGHSDQLQDAGRSSGNDEDDNEDGVPNKNRQASSSVLAVDAQPSLSIWLLAAQQGADRADV